MLICLETINTKNYNCNNCKNDFHLDCIKIKKRMSL